MELVEILDKISVLNRDNGKRFTNTERLNVITSLLWKSEYRRINPDGLFHLYAKVPLDSFQGRDAVIVSSHVDCEKSISRCFSRPEGNGLLRGTYDNAITNASILFLMLQDALPVHVLVAFTGDEEKDSTGAKHLEKFLHDQNIRIRHLFVLDVTDLGWHSDRKDSSVFTIENDFWRDDYGKIIVEAVKNKSYTWNFVPSDTSVIPAFVPPEKVILCEAEEDESWFYDEKGVNCCSICLPIQGEMHSDEGVLAWETSFRQYTDILKIILSI